MRDPEKEVKVELVYANGKRQPYQLTPEDALKFAQEAALKFVIRQPERPFEFNPKEAKEELAKSDKERKAKRRGGNVVPESQGSNAPGAQA